MNFIMKMKIVSITNVMIMAFEFFAILVVILPEYPILGRFSLLLLIILCVVQARAVIELYKIERLDDIYTRRML